MMTFTSTLPEDSFEKLSQMSKEMNIPKNKIIQRALNMYLKELDKALYRKSFKKYKEDVDVLSIAEEGMQDYISQIDILDEAG